jgi:flagellar hook-length control protein FliK
VVNQTNLISILPAPTIGNTPLTGDIANLGDSSFQSYMKDAVKESSVAKDNDVSTNNERRERASLTEPNRSERPDTRPVDESARPETEQVTDSNFREKPAVDNATDERQVLTDDRTQPQESIDSLELKEGQVYTEINVLLQSIAQQLNLNPDDLLVDPSAGPLAQQQKLLSLLQSQGGQAAELLTKAGLTEQQAQNLLSKIQSTQGNHAQLQAGKESVDDALVKLGGEKSAESKANFLSQFSDLNKQGDKPQRQASIEKVLTQSANDPVQELTQKPLEKVVATAPKLQEIFQSQNNQANPLVAQQTAANNSLKNTQGLKAPTEIKVQSVNAVSESAGRTVEGAKPVSAETLSAKGTTEARVINQIINKVSLRANGSKSEVKIRLDPPSLGALRMNVTTAGDSVRTVIIAENHTVKQIIENNLLQLRDSMQNQGLKVDSFTVLGGGDEGQAGQQNTAQEGRSNFAGSLYREQNSAPETFSTEPLVTGQTQILNYDSKSLSVFA